MQMPWRDRVTNSNKHRELKIMGEIGRMKKDGKHLKPLEGVFIT
jgi:hypothetical protein